MLNKSCNKSRLAQFVAGTLADPEMRDKMILKLLGNENERSLEKRFGSFQCFTIRPFSFYDNWEAIFLSSFLRVPHVNIDVETRITRSNSISFSLID